MTRELGILFSAPMVRAILDGRKTQTRRILKSEHAEDAAIWRFDAGRGLWESGIASGAPGSYGHGEYVRCPYGVVGDRLWVRETWRTVHSLDAIAPSALAEYVPIHYDSDDSNRGKFREPVGRCRPGIHMPRWASRITLEVTEVRVQRLQEITEEDAKAEGVEPYEFSRRVYPSDLAAEVVTLSYREGFHSLWNAINGKRAGWAESPWVWAVGFRCVEATRGER